MNSMVFIAFILTSGSSLPSPFRACRLRRALFMFASLAEAATATALNGRALISNICYEKEELRERERPRGRGRGGQCPSR